MIKKNHTYKITTEEKKDLIVTPMEHTPKVVETVEQNEVPLENQATQNIVECTEERSQFMNKKKALRRLMAVLMANNEANLACNINSNWQKHNELVRGNPIRVYEGCEFRRIV